MKIDVDFHETSPEAAIGELDRLMAHFNVVDTNIELKIVTGHGYTRKLVQQYLDHMGIEWVYEGANDGCMLVYLGEEYEDEG